MSWSSDHARIAIFAMVALSTAGVLARPFRTPEAIWAVGGAAAVVALGLLPMERAVRAVGKGADVYLFLAGMMLLAEVARREGLFDRVAAIAVVHARGSPRRLFLLVYAVGVVVTTFLSNDATAVVLTPAVYAAARKADVEPLPYLFVCALVANAASFVLPISNPANIVLYGDHTPALGTWLARFALPSLASILATYFAMRMSIGKRLEASCRDGAAVPPLSTGIRVTTIGIAATAIALLVVSSLDRPLGLPTAIMGTLTTFAVAITTRRSPVPVVACVSWSVLALVAGLFVLVEALDATGTIAALARLLRDAASNEPTATAWLGGAAIAVGSNVVNNLPAGLVASSAIALAPPPQPVVDALLIGVDLGPNLSVTGSLATILWLTAIRREGEDVGFRRFLGVGAVTMPPALAASLLIRLW